MVFTVNSGLKSRPLIFLHIPAGQTGKRIVVALEVTCEPLMITRPFDRPSRTESFPKLATRFLALDSAGCATSHFL